eukprot:TRINITY_DN70136_c0_g1_i1.p1 TRINITY_DN70136_c0_g1~~TRINITY_DN70136_c0_g1_i1.p1  ORF type:complete len:634 (+),score=243.60 TRINITY_DN70136_c0_g1_i1:67-1902(+)
MGFGTADVLSDDPHTSEFICKICGELVDMSACAYTACTHVFCASCLDKWFAQGKRKCPWCQTGLKSNEVGDLRHANPLAFRILGRIRVRCPLHSTERGCGWLGEYSEVYSHLTNSSSHSPEEAQSAIRAGSVPREGLPASPTEPPPKRSRDSDSAAALKEQGNAKFHARAWGDAVALYSKAIAMAPREATYLTNRAAAYLMLARYRDCVADCELAISIDPGLAKAYMRLAKAKLEMGDIAGSLGALRVGVEHAPGNEELRAELEKVESIDQWVREGEAALDAGRDADAAQFFSSAAQLTSSHHVLLLLARAELRLGRSDGVLRRTRDILRDDRGNVLAYTVRAEALMLSNDLDQAVIHAQEAVKLDPDNQGSCRFLKKVRKVKDAATKGRRMNFERRFEEGDRLLSEAIELAAAPRHAPLAAALHADRADSRLRLGRLEDALKDCAVAIYAQDDCRKAWLTRAACLNALGRFQETYDEMGELLRKGFDQDEAVRGAYYKAEFELRRRARPDYYGMLGVGQLASEAEIKAAYKQRAMVLHPDKVDADAPPEEKAKCEAMFKQLGDALEILTDDFKRKLWDEGYDKAAIEERVQAANRAARERPRGHGHSHHH